MVAYGAHVVLGLPHTPTLDARAGVQRIDDPPAEQIRGDRRRRDRQLPGRRRNLAIVVSRVAEDKLNREVAARNCAAGLIERSSCNASGNKNTR